MAETSCARHEATDALIVSLLIPSVPLGVDQRQAVRETWMADMLATQRRTTACNSPADQPRPDRRVVCADARFFIGMEHHRAVTSHRGNFSVLAAEFAQHGDVVMSPGQHSGQEWRCRVLSRRVRRLRRQWVRSAARRQSELLRLCRRKVTNVVCGLAAAVRAATSYRIQIRKIGHIVHSQTEASTTAEKSREKEREKVRARGRAGQRRFAAVRGSAGRCQ